MSPINAQDTLASNEIYNPPRLPAVLGDAHCLEPIIGVPANEEVKAIHAAIRAVNGILNVPSLYDPDVPMQLAQHLFNAQMAVYRSTYSFSIFPGDATYIPPPVPSYIPYALEPVVGAPSDEELKLAQNAVRAIENLASTPSIFDPDLSLTLSQHLFNLQTARYIQQSTQGQFTPELERPQSASRREQTEVHHASEAVLIARSLINPPDETEVIGVEELHPNLDDMGQPTEPAPVHSPPEQFYEVQQASDETKVGSMLEGATRMLSEMGEVLRSINHTIISTQHSLIGLKSNGDIYALLGQNGDLPSNCGLPRLCRGVKNGYYYLCKHSGGDLTDQQLAAYLKLYNIGINLIEDGTDPTILPEKKSDAERLLYKYLHEHPGSACTV